MVVVFVGFFFVVVVVVVDKVEKRKSKMEKKPLLRSQNSLKLLRTVHTDSYCLLHEYCSFSGDVLDDFLTPIRRTSSEEMIDMEATR